MNQKVKEMYDAAAAQCSVGSAWDWEEAFAKQVVGETILAVLATDHRHAQFTTFDKAAIDGATARIVDSITKHWNFK